MIDCRNTQINVFIEELSSGSPTPGGGGASALCGAVGTALSAMVCSLTSGKKRYAQFQPDIERILSEAKQLNASLLKLVDADKDAFLPLAAAYSMPQSTDEEKADKEAALQAALTDATRVPLEIMKAACRGIELHAELVDKCSKLAISDVGVGVALLKAALLGASLNVFINTRLMTNPALKNDFNAQADNMLDEYPALSDRVFERVSSELRS